MDPHRVYSLSLLIVVSLFSLHAEVIYGDSSVLFLDSPTRHYLRASDQTVSLSPSEIGATASVLLGFAPPSTLTAASSSKLNNVLVPNPFDKPRALLMVELTGAEDSQLVVHSEKSPSSNTLRIKVEGNERVDIQLPEDEDELSMVSLNEVSSNAECSDKELSDFASWLGGSYVEDASQSLNGELLIPIADGAFMRLHMSERADKEFATSLVILISNMRKAMELHQVLTKSKRSPAELIAGRFDGIKALRDQYGKEGIAQSGMEVVVNSISKILDSFQAPYQGKIVGIVAHKDRVESKQENMFQFTVNTRQSARFLQEANLSPAQLIIIAEVAFVRLTLAWITGIILLIATILGIYYLLSMPITKDTLLYSNVKLD